MKKFDKPLIAISYDTMTYADLAWFIKQNNGQAKILRLTPEEFFQNPSPDFYYINLVVRDRQLRQRVSLELDTNKLDRFSYVHPSSVVCVDLSDLGIFVYPNCTIYPSAVLDKDIIIHSNSSIAHGVTVGQGTFISSGVIVGGNTHFGAFNKIGLGVIVYDKVRITDHVTVGARSVIKDDITVGGKYDTVFTTENLFSSK